MQVEHPHYQESWANLPGECGLMSEGSLCPGQGVLCERRRDEEKRILLRKDAPPFTWDVLCRLLSRSNAPPLDCRQNSWYTEHRFYSLSL